MDQNQEGPSGQQLVSTLNIKELLDTLQSPQQRDDLKLKALQEINENFENLISTPQFGVIAESLIRVFLRILQDTRPQFIGENNTQQLRKLMLEMIHRIPYSESIKQYTKLYTNLLFRLVQAENEENVLLCLRILMEVHKQFRPAYTTEVEHFLAFVKTIYRDFGSHAALIFEPKPALVVSDISEFDFDAALQTTFSLTTIGTEKKLPDGTVITYTLLPRGQYSLKVLAELPVIIVLFYQLYKAQGHVHKELAEFLPLLLHFINMQPQK